MFSAGLPELDSAAMVQVSPSTRASKSETVVPPPLPQAVSSELLDETFEDIRQLTADIDRLISKRSTLRLVHPPQLATGALSGIEQRLPDDENGLSDFDWESAGRARLRRADRISHSAGDTAEQTADWILRSRQQRRFNRMRTAGSWALALGVAIAIAVASVVVLKGDLPGRDLLAQVSKVLGL